MARRVTFSWLLPPGGRLRGGKNEAHTPTRPFRAPSLVAANIGYKPIYTSRKRQSCHVAAPLPKNFAMLQFLGAL